MAQVYNRIAVDVRTETTDIITAVQNDSNSRFLDVFLLDNGLPIDLTGREVRIYGKKADGTEIYNDGQVTEETNGRCQFELTDQALAVAQDLEVQIVIYYNNVQILQSLPFKIHVVKSLISDSAIPSSNEYGALVVLYQNLYEAYDLMTTMVQNMGTNGTIATSRNADTFWKMLEYMAEYLDTDITNLLNTVLSEANVQGVIDRLGETTDTGATATVGTVMGKSNAILNRSKHGYYAPIRKSERKEISSTAGTVKLRFDGKKRIKKIFLGASVSNEFAINITVDGVTQSLFAAQSWDASSSVDDLYAIYYDARYGDTIRCHNSVTALRDAMDVWGHFWEFDVEEYFEIEFYKSGVFGSDVTRAVAIEYEERG